MKSKAPPAEENSRVTCNGKQVLLDGVHFADAVSEDAANVIRLCLQHGRIPSFEPGLRFVEEFFA